MKTKLTKEQYELLENFGLNRIDTASVNVEELRKAARAAILVIPFKLVSGMEHMAPSRPSRSKSDPTFAKNSPYKVASGRMVRKGRK